MSNYIIEEIYTTNGNIDSEISNLYKGKVKNVALISDKAISSLDNLESILSNTKKQSYIFKIIDKKGQTQFVASNNLKVINAKTNTIYRIDSEINKYAGKEGSIKQASMVWDTLSEANKSGALLVPDVDAEAQNIRNAYGRFIAENYQNELIKIAKEQGLLKSEVLNKKGFNAADFIAENRSKLVSIFSSNFIDGNIIDSIEGKTGIPKSVFKKIVGVDRNGFTPDELELIHQNTLDKPYKALASQLIEVHIAKNPEKFINGILEDGWTVENSSSESITKDGKVLIQSDMKTVDSKKNPKPKFIEPLRRKDITIADARNEIDSINDKIGDLDSDMVEEKTQLETERTRLRGLIEASNGKPESTIIEKGESDSEWNRRYNASLEEYSKRYNDYWNGQPEGVITSRSDLIIKDKNGKTVMKLGVSVNYTGGSRATDGFTVYDNKQEYLKVKEYEDGKLIPKAELQIDPINRSAHLVYSNPNTNQLESTSGEKGNKRASTGSGEQACIVNYAAGRSMAGNLSSDIKVVQKAFGIGV